MKFLKLYKNSQVFKIALGIAILVICYIATVFYAQMQELNKSVEVIANSNETQLELEKLLSVISIYENLFDSSCSGPSLQHPGFRGGEPACRHHRRGRYARS